jgi:hypothetical protein
VLVADLLVVALVRAEVTMKLLELHAVQHSTYVAPVGQRDMQHN